MSRIHADWQFSPWNNYGISTEAIRQWHESHSTKMEDGRGYLDNIYIDWKSPSMVLIKELVKLTIDIRTLDAQGSLL